MKNTIIDADTHISFTGEANSITAEALIKSMDKAGIDKAITWIHPPYVRTLLPSLLDYLKEKSDTYPDRIIPFGWADPHLGHKESKKIIRKSLREYNFYGVKLNGAQNEYPIDDPDISLPLIKEIADMGGIAAFHCGADVRDYTHPYRIGRIARLFPDLKILMIHMGGASFTDFSTSAIEVAEKYKNITIIGSAIRSIPLIKAIKILGPERIAFGSDAPFELQYIEKSKYETILQTELPDKCYDLIMGKTIERILGLV